MDIKEIKEKLILAFSAPLREYYKRHIIFWDDPEKEFTDGINEVSLDGVTIIKLTDRNFFSTKMLINDDSTGNLLIYDNNSERDDKGNWFLDARIYADQILHFDFYSMLMSRLGITMETSNMRKAIKAYNKFWKNDERIEKLHKIVPNIQSTSELHLGILAVLCNASSIDKADILFNVFNNGLDLTTNKCVKSVETFGNIEALWALINKYVGNCHENLVNAFDTILISALYQTMGSNIPNKLDSFVYKQGALECYSLVNEWTRNENFKEDVYELLVNIENKFDLFDLFDALSIDDLVTSDIFPVINVTLLRKLFSASASKAIQGSKLITIVEGRRKGLWYSKYSNYFECIYYIGQLFNIYSKYQTEFCYTSDMEIWDAYKKELYLFDTYYRYIHYYVYKSSFETIDDIQDKLNDSLNFVENLYKNSFINNLNDIWIKDIKDSLDTTGRINNKIPYQTDFYNSYVRGSSDDRLTIVIVSDGMRFEVAKELSEKLAVQLKCTVKVDAMQAVFPAITKYGMAALLPGEKTIVGDAESLDVLSSGMKTNNLQARKAVLQENNLDSDAISYPDLFKMNSIEKKEFLKGKKVIYIYHDDIDSSGHDSVGESKVFAACGETIDKLVALVRSLTIVRGSIKILITSDHGFLYSYKKLNEVDKLSLKSDVIVDALGEKRCIVCNKPIDTDFMIPVKMRINNESNSLIGYAPYQAIRLKTSGGAGNYVHGGLTLEEMMVPVIVYDNVRTDSKNYLNNKDKYNHNPVKIELITEKREFHGSIVKLEFYQSKPIGLDAVEATYEVLFENRAGKAVSSTGVIVANKTDNDAANRRFKATMLTINSNIQTDTYYLMVNNQETHENIMKIECKIVNDFGGDFDF